MLNLESNYIHNFSELIENIKLPEKFTFPFCYTPHPLVLMAAKQIQTYLENQKEWVHNFGIVPHKKGMVIGKMFGVMVVKKQNGDIRFLAAFSGKLAERNHIKGFVPPIFDMLDEKGFFKLEEIHINNLNAQIEAKENDPRYHVLLRKMDTLLLERDNEVARVKKVFSESRKERRRTRKQAKQELAESDYKELHVQHIKESYWQQQDIKGAQQKWESQIEALQHELKQFENQIESYKNERKERSHRLQNKLFDQYHFLNKHLESKNVIDVFNDVSIDIPPSGAGDCAAPKLLQFAYQNNLEPLCMGEFWWGQGPKSEVRQHGYFYPSCRGKCEPILSHMLTGLTVDPNPMLQNMAEGKSLEVIYEDDTLVIINKPPEFLSVPGKSINDSVYLRMKTKYPKATGPLIVHRLDMSTSGIMIIAKTKESHKAIQKEFLNRKVKKRYVAILEGQINDESGEIKLPLRVNLNDRPRQLVCYEHGKKAHTKYEVINRSIDETKVYFYPLTGRTHQLRVHAAHLSGLNSPIKGDDLYGAAADRLYLHAEYIRFKHPTTEEYVEFECAAGF